MSLLPTSHPTKLLDALPLARRMRHRAMLSVLTIVGVAGVAACNASDPVDTSTPTASTLEVVAATDSQRATVTTSLPSAIAVRVKDQNGNLLPSAPVAWAVISGGGSVSLGISGTDANGEAATVWTLGRSAGVQMVTATLITGVADTVIAIGVAGPAASFALLAGDNQTLPVGQTSAPLRVRALDQYNNVVPGISVTWSTTGGTLSATDSATDAAGVASVTLQPAAGPQVVTARLSNGATLTFNLRGEP